MYLVVVTEEFSRLNVESFKVLGDMVNISNHQQLGTVESLRPMFVNKNLKQWEKEKYPRLFFGQRKFPSP